MQNPHFSILIANYNNGKYLEEALQSVFQQTCTDWEIVLVDDCSTDGLSAEIYAKYANDGRVKIYHNDKNMGCGYTKRRCAELATGQWCVYLDPDDTLRNDTLAIMVDHISQYPQYKAFFGHMYVCDEKMNVVYDSTYPYGSALWNEFIHFQKAIPPFFFERETYLQTDGIDAMLTQSVDIDLYYKMVEKTEFYYIDMPLYYYRNNPTSISKNKSVATATHLWVMLQSLQRVGATDEQVRKELAAFWDWRTRDMREEIASLKRSKWYKLHQLWRKIRK